MNETTIKWNDYNRDKITKLGSSLNVNLSDPANHKIVQAAIRKIFPCAAHKPNMYAVYVALASDLTKFNEWEDVLKQWAVCGVNATWEDEGDNERLTCICSQNVGYTLLIKNLITGVELHVGSECVFKNCITEYQKDQYNYAKKQLNKKKREKAAERKRIKELEENFICCKKCKEYVIPRQGNPITTCFDCRSKEGKRKCPCCGHYRIKENTTYTKCFECYKLKK
jgi:hypothetical protein